MRADEIRRYGNKLQTLLRLNHWRFVVQVHRVPQLIDIELKNPYAHLRMEDISIEKVKESPMLWDPLHFFEACPSSDGAAAMVVTNARRLSTSTQRPRTWSWR